MIHATPRWASASVAHHAMGKMPHHQRLRARMTRRPSAAALALACALAGCAQIYQNDGSTVGVRLVAGTPVSVAQDVANAQCHRVGKTAVYLSNTDIQPFLGPMSDNLVTYRCVAADEGK